MGEDICSSTDHQVHQQIRVSGMQSLHVQAEHISHAPAANTVRKGLSMDEQIIICQQNNTQADTC